MQAAESFARLASNRLLELAREEKEREAAWNHSLRESFDRVLVALWDVIKSYPYVGPKHDHARADSSWWEVQVQCGQPLTTFVVRAASGGHLQHAHRAVVARAEALLRAFLSDKGFQVDVNPRQGLTIRLPTVTETESAAASVGTCETGCAASAGTSA
jgi:hypothetical protein